MDRHFVPSLGLAVVIGLATILIGVIVLRGPDTRGNLWNEARPGYTRSTVATVGGGVTPFSHPWMLGDSIASPENPGRRVYLGASCNACHGLDALGGAVGPPIAGTSSIIVKAFVRLGPGGMPAYSEDTLNEEQLDKLVVYLQGLEATQPSAEVSPLATLPSAEADSSQVASETPTPDQASLGQQYFSSRGCALCHGPRGGGSGIAPRIAGDSPQRIRDTVRSGMGLMRAFPQDVLPEAELAAIIAYLQSLAQ